MKRFVDLVTAVCGLVLLSPVLVVVGLVVVLTSGRPMFYKHKRVGRGFAPISVLKFRTMANARGSQITSGSDPRITRVGAILRRYKIDELPQLVNVVRGEMSLVGPRPEVEEYVNLYRLRYAELLTVRPGMTDPASLTYRNEELLLAKSDDPDLFYRSILLPQKISLSSEYVANASVTRDLKIIAETVAKLIQR